MGSAKIIGTHKTSTHSPFIDFLFQVNNDVKCCLQHLYMIN